LLGPLRVTDGDREIPLPRQKHRALLAVLLLHLGETLTVDRLLDELWGERPPATAKNALHNYVSHLRKTLGPEVLRTDSAGYVLEAEPDDFDVTQFEGLLDAARAQAAPERASTLARALALWRGPALAGLEFERFAHGAASRLEELRTEAHEELVSAEMSLGRNAELIPRIEELVARNPLRERLHGQLMLALYRSGRQAEALAAYQYARRTLVDELGIEPGPSLRSLEQAILRHDPALDEDTPVSSVEPRPADLRERRTTVTVLYAEVSARTDLDAERYGRLAARTFNELRAATEYHGGTVERLAGDELLAVFGVPERHEDDALRAARAALQIRSATQSSDETEVRIALDTGEVVATGPALRARIGGAPVARAKRLAEGAPPGEVVASSETLELLGDAAVTRPVASLVPRGSSTPVSVHRVEEVRETARRGPAARTPLTGRVAELRALGSAIDDVVEAGRSAVFTVLGDAGVGKTRLAAELARSLGDEVNLLVGRCVSYGSGATWLPLRGLAQTANVDVEHDVAETIETLVSGGAVSVADASWAVRRLLESAARDRPALVVLDDVHWAAPTFLDFVGQLVESPVDARVLVMCLARPELAAERPALASLRLEPLSGTETVELVDAAADKALPTDARARIAELAEGNPLFAEQLVAYARERGVDALGSVPPTIDALLASRLDRLDAEERSVLQRAAVIGREFWHGAVLEVTPPLEVPAVGRHLDELTQKGLIHTTRSSSEREDAFRFHHVLVRDVAYASLPKSQRSELHEAVAGWLDSSSGAEDAIVGHHLEQAYRYRNELGPPDPHTEGLAVAAGRRLSSAGLVAHQRGDSPAAADLLDRATRLLPQSDTVASDLLCELAIAEWSRDDAPRALETLDRAIAAARLQQSERAELRARVEQANLQAWTEGRADELLRLAEDALPVFEQFEDARALGRTWLHVGWVLGGVQRQNEAWRDATERALAHYRRTSWSVATCVGDLASALLLGPVPATAARARCRELLDDPEHDRLARAHVQVALAGLEAMLKRFAEARRLIARARTVYEESGFVLAVAGRSDRSLGRIELLAQRPREAELVFRSCCETFERTGDRASLATTASELAEALYRRREYPEASRWIAVAEEVVAENDRGAQWRWRSVKAKLCAATGDTATARELAEAAVEITLGSDALNERGDALVGLAEVLRHADKPVDAADAARQACALYRQKENRVAAGQAQKLVDALGQPSAA
jgi:DNA-binding SARP family transcriptional activator